MQSPPFTPAQIRNTCLVIFVIVFVVLGAQIVLPFLPAILWAAVLSILISPIHQKLEARYKKGWTAKFGETIASLVATLITLFLICIPMIAVGTLAVSQISPALQDLQGQTTFEITQKIDAAIKPLAAKVGMKDLHVQGWWETNKGQVVQGIRGPAGKFASQAGFTAFTLVISLLSMFFFLRDSKALKKPFLLLCGLPTDRGEKLLEKLCSAVHAVFTGTVLVAILQGAVMGVTYAFLGVPNSALLGFISVLLCIVPLLGAPVIYVPVGLLFLAQGETTKALVVLGVGFLVVSQIDNLLKPFLIGSRVALHPLAIFFFVLGGISFVGPIGLMVGPMVLVILLTLYDYFQELMGARDIPEDEVGESELAK